jgi:hypothetical protein
MAWRRTGSIAVLLLLTVAAACRAQHAYAGFDRNNYPGDAALPALHASFHYTSYWLNNPPGENQNSWTGKRAMLKQNGFGFLVLFDGRAYSELKGNDASALGTADGKAAVAAAAREGFPANVLIFLDQEEGGRLLPEQAAYLFAWADAVRAGGARAGVYCSGIDVPEGKTTINTARDIVEKETARAKNLPQAKPPERLKLWIADDRCPPSPGCALAVPHLSSELSPAVANSAVVWQYAQSPRRSKFSAHCPKNQAKDGMCYAPGLANSADTFVDLNSANSPDPSEGR